MNSLLQLNKLLRKYEKHLDVILLVDGVKTNTELERVSAYSTNTVTFVLKDSEDSSIKYEIMHDYSNGTLKCTDDSKHVEIVDLFSRRHTRSILFFVWDYAFKERNEMTELTRRVHEKMLNPQCLPEIWTSVNDDLNTKRYFKIDNVIELNDKHLTLDGILSIKDKEDFFLFPVKATLKYTYKDNTFKWTYTIGGQKVQLLNKEYCESSGMIMITNILYHNADMLLENNCKNSSVNAVLNKGIADIMKGEEIHLCAKKNNYGMNTDYLYFKFISVSLVTCEEIQFQICDGEQPYTTISYDRIKNEFVAKVFGYGGRKTKVKYIFYNANHKDAVRFRKILSLIDNHC